MQPTPKRSLVGATEGVTLVMLNTDLLSRNLKIQRAKKGWSQERLSKESGLSLGSIGHYVLGDPIPGIDSLAKIAIALGCSIDYLVGLSKIENLPNN